MFGGNTTIAPHTLTETLQTNNNNHDALYTLVFSKLMRIKKHR